MNCTVCGSPNPTGRVSCVVCRSPVAIRWTRPQSAWAAGWLTERLRRTIRALVPALVGGAVALLYFIFSGPEPSRAAAETAALALVCGGLATGAALGLLGPTLVGGLRRLPGKLRLAALNRRVGNSLEQIVRNAREQPSSAEERSRLAAALYLQGEKTKAFAVLEEACKQTPEDPVLLHNHAALNAAQGLFAQALDGFRQSQNLGGGEVAETNLALAASASSSKEAVEACRRAWERHPERLDLLNHLVACLADLGHAQEALARLQSGLAQQPADTDLLINLGVLRFSLGDFAGGLQQFETACEREPPSRWAHHNAGLCYLLQGHAEEARAHFAAALRQEADFAPTLGQLALLNKAHNSGRSSLEQLSQAVRAAPGDFESRHNLALFLLETGKEEDALPEAERAVALRADNHDALINLTAAGHLTRRYRSALDTAGRAAALFPESAAARYDLTLVLDALERYEEASAQLEQLLEQHPNFAAAWNNLGVMRLLLGHSVEAAEAFIRAAGLLPQEPRLRSNLALAHYLEGDAAAAHEQAKIAAREAPDLPPLLDIQGHINSERKHPKEASEFWARLAAREPTNAEVLTNLGIAYYRDGQADAAVECLRKALLLQPRSIVAHNNLGLAYAKNKLLAEALHHLGKVVEMQPDNPIVHSNLGLVEYFRGEAEKAMHHWREVTRLSPAYARRREATRLSAYDESEMAILPINRSARALRMPLLFGASCHEARFSLPPPRFELLLPWPDLAEVRALQKKIEEIQARLPRG